MEEPIVPETKDWREFPGLDDYLKSRFRTLHWEHDPTLVVLPRKGGVFAIFSRGQIIPGTVSTFPRGKSRLIEVSALMAKFAEAQELHKASVMVVERFKSVKVEPVLWGLIVGIGAAMCFRLAVPDSNWENHLHLFLPDIPRQWRGEFLVERMIGPGYRGNPTLQDLCKLGMYATYGGQCWEITNPVQVTGLSSYSFTEKTWLRAGALVWNRQGRKRWKPPYASVKRR